jgi:hypothetical protein
LKQVAFAAMTCAIQSTAGLHVVLHFQSIPASLTPTLAPSSPHGQRSLKRPATPSWRKFVGRSNETLGGPRHFRVLPRLPRRAGKPEGVYSPSLEFLKYRISANVALLSDRRSGLPISPFPKLFAAVRSGQFVRAQSRRTWF